MTTQQKIDELNKIAEEIKAFKGLDIAKNVKHPVPGEGNPDAKILFIGEAPGQVEDGSGRPFVGRSGQMMRTVLTETTGIQPDEVFITNIVKYRPPDNRDPFDNEIEACRDWLDRQIAVIRPKIIVTLGRFSMAKFIPGVTISRVHGIPRNIQLTTDNLQLNVTVFPIFHPAAALRGTGTMMQFRQDFVKLHSLINPPAPITPKPTEPEVPAQASLF